MRKTMRMVGATLVVVVVLGGLTLAAWRLSRPQPRVVQGQVEATEVNVSAKVPGRVSDVLVREGDRVERGTPVAIFDSPEIRARLEQAEAARAAAAAQSDKAVRGAREEEIRQAQNAWLRAQHAAELADKTYNRVNRLVADGVLPLQRRDEAEAQLKTARDAEAIAKAAYDMAAAGARDEDKAAAAALVDRATGAVAEVQAAMRETKLLSPASGEVYRRNVEPGEIVAAGSPLVTLVKLDDTWVTFQLREDELAAYAMGRAIVGRVPALGNRAARFVVSYVAPAGDFATWRPTSAQGGFDLKTFEVRARPMTPIAGLRPGMSVVVDGK